NGLGQYQICICTRGCGVFSVDGAEYSIKKGDVFYLSPEEGHEYYPHDNSWTIIWIVFNGKEMKSLAGYFDFEKTFVCHADESMLDRMIEICERLYDTYNKNERYEFSLTTDMLKLLECVSSCEKILQQKTASDTKGGFSPVIDYIKKYYMNFITLEDMAETLGLSKSHFCRQFKEFYKVTPMVYLNRYRISVAKFLLTTTVESIDVIAGKTGFSDTSYFCAVFKKVEGCSPVQYRKRHEQ
ncbi:MAG: helix-turn-helix domain-containing protein, partial [Clostridia bacterium]|nr:helix-turn-helix domain-containing protein [Clostridia bacterium]